jgi:hypothetical protein
MIKKNTLLILLVLLLGGLSFYINRDRFGVEPVQVSDRSMQPRGAGLRQAGDSAANLVVFLFSRELSLTSVKVVVASDAATNKHPRAIWELASDSGSAPVKDFIYGMNIQGMKPAATGALAESLQPGVKYRLLVAAGSRHFEHDFIPTPRMP